jgi:hypothetical protein
MNITDEERGVLLTKMADDSAASILERSPTWVRKARAFLTPNVAINESVKAPSEAVAPKRRGRRPKLELVESTLPPILDDEPYQPPLLAEILTDGEASIAGVPVTRRPRSPPARRVQGAERHDPPGRSTARA